ncbi:hypothetical protein EMCRGX_G010366 [Ephydatia muelleri]
MSTPSLLSQPPSRPPPSMGIRPDCKYHVREDKKAGLVAGSGGRARGGGSEGEVLTSVEEVKAGRVVGGGGEDMLTRVETVLADVEVDAVLEDMEVDKAKGRNKR